MEGEYAKPDQTGIELFGRTKARIASSLDLTTPVGRRLLSKSMNECNLRATEVVNTPLTLVDYIVHDVTIKGEDDSEVIDAVRLVLVIDDGRTAECVSEGILESLKRLLWVYGGKIPVGGLKFAVKTKKKGERSIYWLEDQSDDPAPIRTTGKKST